MKIYEKYLLKLLFSRFGAIFLCTSIFLFFQEMAKGELLEMCSFNEMMMIIPLMLPLLLFQFLPFMFFGTLILVMNEIYSNNELISFKVIGISNCKIMKIFFHFTGFMLCFFLFLALIYPATNKFFNKQKNSFGASNVLKMLQPNKINRIKNYDIFFTKIDKDDILHNVSIIVNTKDKKNNIDAEKKKIIYSKNMVFGYNEFDELIAKCYDNEITNINFDKKTENKENEIMTKNTIFSDKMDVLFSTFFQVNNNNYINYRNHLRQIGLITLIKIKAEKKEQKKIKQIELQGRIVIYWFIIIALTCACCLLLLRQTNRIPSKKITLLTIIFGAYISLSRAFILDLIIIHKLEFIYYLHFIAMSLGLLFFVWRKDKIKR